MRLKSVICQSMTSSSKPEVRSEDKARVIFTVARVNNYSLFENV